MRFGSVGPYSEQYTRHFFVGIKRAISTVLSSIFTEPGLFQFGISAGKCQRKTLKQLIRESMQIIFTPADNLCIRSPIIC